MNRWWPGLLLVFGVALTETAVGQDIRAIDGDTIRLGGTVWRLHGIDAPESKQWCGDYPAGAIATGSLSNLIRDQIVSCEYRSTDRYGRSVGLCRINGVDLGKLLVRTGAAWAFRRYSRDYVEVEDMARADNLGVHTHRCQPAWEWRAEHR